MTTKKTRTATIKELSVETFPNPERSQNRRFSEKSGIKLRTGKFRPTQSHNLLLAKLILSPTLGSAL